jgi:hypothetical protein
MQLVDYASALAAAQRTVPDWREGDMREAQLAIARAQPDLIQAQIARSQAQTQQETQEAAYQDQRRTMFQTKLQGLGARPNAKGLYDISAQFPEFATALQGAAKGITTEDATKLVRHLAPIQSLIAAGQYSDAADDLNRHIKADRDAGIEPDEHDVEMLEMLRSGDPKRAQTAGGIAFSLMSALDPEKAAATLGKREENKRHVITQGSALVDDDGTELYSRAPAEANALDVGVYDDQGHRVGTQLIPNGGRGGAASGYATPDYGSGSRSNGAGGGDVSRLINTDAGGGYVPEGVKTLGQFVGFGKSLNARGAKSSSAGTYQINGTTMAEFAPKALGADWKDAPFNADSQERVGEAIFNWAKQQPNPAAALRGRWVSLDPGTASQLVQGNWQQARGTIAQGETGGGAGASAAARTAPGASGYIGPVATPGTGGDPTLTGDAYLATVPAYERAKIKAIAEGRVAAPRPGTKFGEAVLTKVAQYDPTFDAANSQSRLKTRTDFTSGKSAQAVNALNTAMGHLLHLDTQAKDLGNFSTLPGILNPVYNAGRRVAGDTKLPAFQQTKQAASSEMRKVFAGSAGGNLTELKEWQESLDSSQSYEQLHAAIKNGVELMGSRLNALQDQYQTGMGRSDQPMQLIKPGVANATRKRFGIDLGGHGGSSGGAAARPQPATPASSRFRILKVRPK